MKVVVADTSPINYLILIDCIDLLRSLYTRVVVPEEVWSELLDEGAPERVATWIRSKPDWIDVRIVPVDFNPTLQDGSDELDAGELAAIQLAFADADSLLLIDEMAGRAYASRLGVAHMGTLGVLSAASKEGLVDLKTSLHQLQRTNFRVSQSLIDGLLE